MKEKIIQITAIPFNCEAGYILFGLGDNGKVWSYNQEKDVWERHVRPLKDTLDHYQDKSNKPMNLPIEKQVCSLEYAQKLKELGVKQEGHFMWVNFNNETSLMCREEEHHNFDHWLHSGYFPIAFTCGELGEMLPERVLTNKGHTKWSCRWWTGDVMRTDKATNGYVVEADTEADARAKMVCYLLENHLIRLD